MVSVGFFVLLRKWDFSKLQLDFSEYHGVRHGENLQVKEDLPAAGGIS